MRPLGREPGRRLGHDRVGLGPGARQPVAQRRGSGAEITQMPHRHGVDGRHHLSMHPCPELGSERLDRSRQRLVQAQPDKGGERKRAQDREHRRDDEGLGRGACRKPASGDRQARSDAAR